MFSHFTEKEACNDNNYIKSCSTSGNKVTFCRFVKEEVGGGRKEWMLLGREKELKKEKPKTKKTIHTTFRKVAAPGGE